MGFCCAPAAIGKLSSWGWCGHCHHTDDVCCMSLGLCPGQRGGFGTHSAWLGGGEQGPVLFHASVSPSVRWGYSDELAHKILQSLLKLYLEGLGLGFPAVSKHQDPSLQHRPLWVAFASTTGRCRGHTEGQTQGHIRFKCCFCMHRV